MTFRRLMLQWFWDTYDHLVALILANMILFVVSGAVVYTWLVVMARSIDGLGVAPIVMLTVASGWIVLTGLLTTWVATFGRVTNLIAGEKELRGRDFLAGWWDVGARALRFSAVAVAGLVAMLVGIWFYALSGLVPETFRVAALGLAGLLFWLLLAWVSVCLVAVAWMVRGGVGVRSALRKGVALLLRRPGLVLGVALHVTLMWLVGGGFKLIGAFLLTFSLTATFLSSLYDVVEAELLGEEELPAPESAGSWKERELLEKAHERRRMDAFRYSRTMKDILKPWEG
ncbi:hypothetical protein GC173_04750 [bacterium]|nr:hypothetical protein [bacterium]